MTGLFIILFPSPIISSDVSMVRDSDQGGTKESLLGREEGFWESVYMGRRGQTFFIQSEFSSACEDGNRKLEEPHWTMRKTSRSVLRQANSPGVDESESSIVPLTSSH